MPELPEVETVRCGLAPVFEGADLVKVTASRPDLRFPFPKNFVSRLTGARVDTLGRRGKYLLAGLSTGETLIMHLGMSGRFVIDDGTAKTPGKFNQAPACNPVHNHVVFYCNNGKPATVTYNDPRRFGFMDLVATQALEDCKQFKAMGPEPLGNGFSVVAFNAALKTKSAPIKAALLDQRVVAGLGNIYVCEALYRAGISPRRRASSVAGRRGERLHSEILTVLRAAIKAGGSSLRDFAGVHEDLGYFQHRFEVYDREGEKCPKCDSEIGRIVQSGRSTFYCSGCQR